MTSIRENYQTLGVQSYYSKLGSTYRNPHEAAVKAALNASIVKWHPSLFSVLDLACGSGEITANLPRAANVIGIDPYTSDAYYFRTGNTALKYTFDEIANGRIIAHNYTLTVCSYAMHLVEPSKLHNLLVALAQITDNMLILSPNKKPIITPGHGFDLIGELYLERVRARYFKSNVKG